MSRIRALWFATALFLTLLSVIIANTMKSDVAVAAGVEALLAAISLYIGLSVSEDHP